MPGSTICSKSLRKVDRLNYETSSPQTIYRLIKLCRKYNWYIRGYRARGIVAKTLQSPYPLGPDHVLSKHENPCYWPGFRFHYGMRCECRDFCTAFRCDAAVFDAYLRYQRCQASGGRWMGQGTMECLLHAGRQRWVQMPPVPDRGPQFPARWHDIHQRRHHHRSSIPGRIGANYRHRVMRESRRRQIVQRTQ